MIYSDDINKICALCLHSEEYSENEIHCKIHNKTMNKSDDACRKFVYDIFKKQVRRKRKLKTNFTAEDFSLE